MPPTSKPWTRAEFVRLLHEARGAYRSAYGPAQLAALKRLEFEFGSTFAPVVRRPTVRVPIPDLGDAEARCDFFSRGSATLDTQHLSLGAVIGNRPDDDFAFYERFELTA